MTITKIDPQRLRQTQEALTGATEAWVDHLKAQFSLLQITSTGRVDPRETLGQAYRLGKGIAQVNVAYIRDLAGASLGIVGVVRDDVGQGADVVKREVGSATKVARDQLKELGDSVVDEAKDLKHIEQGQARRAKRAVRDAAAERYREMTKVELSEELGRRKLRKSGNVAELRARLMEDDRQAD